MKTQKIKLTELRQLVKKIIKEEKSKKNVIKENKDFNVQDFLDQLKDGPYAFPGGYPKYFVTKDGGVLSFEAAKENKDEIISAMKDGYDDQWLVVGVDINWEDSDLYCDHTNKKIECAYCEDEYLEEGLWNQLKTGAKSAFGAGIGDRTGGGLNLGKRFNAAKTGFQQQGKVDNIDKVLEILKPLVDSGKIDPNQTVAQLLNSAGKFQKGSLGQMKAQAKSRISKTRNDIYRK